MLVNKFDLLQAQEFHICFEVIVRSIRASLVEDVFLPNATCNMFAAPAESNHQVSRKSGLQPEKNMTEVWLNSLPGYLAVFYSPLLPKKRNQWKKKTTQK